MECTPASATLATATPLTVSPRTVLDAFATVPDPRRQASIDYPLPAILALAVTAILANHCSVLAIAEWGARQGQMVLAALGFVDGHTPCQSTLQRLFAKLDSTAVSHAVSAYFAPAVAPDQAERGGQGIAIDGKAQRGRLRYQDGGSPIHALTAFCHDYGVVLAQEPIRHGEAKRKAELTVAPALVARLDWTGRVLTGDALFCQRHLCRQILAAGGDYLLLVKENQPALHEDLRLLFDPPADDPGLPPLDWRAVETVEKGHGRTHDRRHLIASTDLVGYSDWPGLAQVFRLEHTWREDGQPKRALHYGITSLPPQIASARRLLELKRGHWGIENGLHRVKDVALGEDASLVPQAEGPSIMALLRDTAISLLHHAGYRTIASRLRYYAGRPAAAAALVVRPLTRA